MQGCQGPLQRATVATVATVAAVTAFGRELRTRARDGLGACPGISRDQGGRRAVRLSFPPATRFAFRALPAVCLASVTRRANA